MKHIAYFVGTLAFIGVFFLATAREDRVAQAVFVGNAMLLLFLWLVEVGKDMKK
jgi:hypothetical protein